MWEYLGCNGQIRHEWNVQCLQFTVTIDPILLLYFTTVVKISTLYIHAWKKVEVRLQLSSCTSSLSIILSPTPSHDHIPRPYPPRYIDMESESTICYRTWVLESDRDTFFVLVINIATNKFSLKKNDKDFKITFMFLE